MTTKQRVRILLVEDNPADVEIVRRVLSRSDGAHFEVHSVDSTRESEDALKQSSFDAILLDNCLPGENGLSFLGRLSDDRHAPPTIMLSGQSGEGLARVALQLGAYDYLPKELISSPILAQAVQRCLERHRLNMRLADNELASAEPVIVTMAAATGAEGHLRMVAHYAVAAGRALGLDEARLLLLRYAGMLHDIGTISLSETVLRKPGLLTEAEREEIRQHPIIGERICRPLRFSNALGPIIRHHHERWDGQGYVDGLAGEEIPLLARVISVVDAFEAMSSDRCYRPALGLNEALRRLREGAGSQWDPDVVDVVADLAKNWSLRERPGKAVS